MGEISKSLRITTNWGMVRLKALIDSGAEENFIRLDILEKMIIKGKMTRHAYKKYGGRERFIGPRGDFDLADGSKKIGYLTAIRVHWENRFIGTEVIASEDIGEQLVLGQPFLQDNHVIINFSKGTLTLGKHAPKYHKIPRL